MIDDKILTEKYRPKNLKDVVGLDVGISNFVEEGNIPHLLFISPPGTGKTTTAKIIIKDLGANFIILNSSDERGIGVVRDKIKSFAMTHSTNQKPKIILLDEVDGTTPDFQHALRNIMETYAGNCKFILTANYDNKIIDAIQSRCVKFRFVTPEREDIKQRLLYIIYTEGGKIHEGALAKLVDIYYPDIRKMINKIQEVLVKTKEIGVEDIHSYELIIPKLWELIKDQQFAEARQLVLDSCVDYASLLEQLYKYMMNKAELSNKVKGILIPKFAECNKHIGHVICKEIEFEYLVLEIMKNIGDDK